MSAKAVCLGWPAYWRMAAMLCDIIIVAIAELEIVTDTVTNATKTFTCTGNLVTKNSS